MNNINPITKLDYPDPDVIRVDDTYYMVSTTMYFMPGCEILRSYDLINWEHAAFVYNRLDSTPAQKLSGKENIYGQGMWAASLRYHDGIFYIVFVANDTHKTYLYTTSDINGPWKKSEIPGFYHDNSVLFDDDGKIYIVYGNTEIHITELYIEKDSSSNITLKPKENGLDKVIITDSSEHYLGYEGAHFYKIDGKYYIFFIHMPKSTGRRTESCFVSDRPEGPYYGKDICDDSRNYRGSGVAQGGIVMSPDKKWYSIMFQDSGAVGRIPVLSPVAFKEITLKELSFDAPDTKVLFPEIGNNGIIPEDFYIKPLKENYKYAPLADSDDFHSELKNCWQFNHEPDFTLLSHDKSTGTLTIKTDKISTNLVQAKNTITQRTLFPSCAASVHLDASDISEGDYAGLCILQSCYGFIGVTKKDDRFFLVMANRTIDTPGIWGERHDDLPCNEISSMELGSPEITLRADVMFAPELSNVKNIFLPQSEDSVQFSYKLKSEDAFTLFGSVHKLEFKLDHFTGARFGLFNFSTKKAGGSATFSDFRYI